MIGYLKPAKTIPRLSENKIPKAYKNYRIRVFLMIFIGYMGFYLVRKNFAVSTPFLVSNLHFSKTEIGLISTSFAMAYGLSKFILGTLADKSNVKYYIGTGLIASSVISVLMGFCTSVPLLISLMVLNGIFQGMGAPPCHIVIGKWFAQKERGLKMGIWNTSHNFGGGLVAPLGTLSLFMFGSNTYQAIFFVPAVITIAIAVMIFVIGADTPESVGLPPIKEYMHEEVLEEEKGIDSSSLSVKEIVFKYVLKNKYIWLLALANIFVYLIRQGIVNWIPLYLKNVKHFSIADANWAMFLYEYSAILATILMGWLSDVVFKGKRAPLGIMCMIGVIGALIVYWKTSSYLVTMISVAFIGCFIYGPLLLINMSLIDLVPSFAVGSADGFAGLCGYLVGELMADLVLGGIADQFGWNGAFIFMIIGALFGLFFLVLLQIAVNKRDRKIAEKEQKVA